MTLQTKALVILIKRCTKQLRNTCFPYLQSQRLNQVRLIICVNILKCTAQTTDHIIASDLLQLMIPGIDTSRGMPHMEWTRLVLLHVWNNHECGHSTRLTLVNTCILKLCKVATAILCVFIQY